MKFIASFFYFTAGKKTYNIDAKDCSAAKRHINKIVKEERTHLRNEGVVVSLEGSDGVGIATRFFKKSGVNEQWKDW